ncbi:MAG: DUF5615 family PIN-like protein [Rhodothermales bacterium]|nr:DUF5615 family PIN-like protein [Rhodothermales bacterium]
MPDAIRYYVDEHVSKAIIEGLRRRGVDVMTVREADMLGATDEEQLAFARGQRRVLFTQDADFLRLHAAGVPHAGIAYAHAHRATTGAVIRGLMLLHDVLEAADMEGQVEFLPVWEQE